MSAQKSSSRWSVVLASVVFATLGGCAHWGPQPHKWLKGWGNGYVPPPAPVSVHTPKELEMGILPTYRIEPPDILSIDLINLVPKSPYRLRTTDSVLLRVTGTLPEAPIEGQYVIELGGSVNLGPEYGQVRIAGLDTDAARLAIEEHLKERLRDPQVNLSILSTAGQQQIAGEHLVGLDGTITLGSYGSVLVTGMSIDEARAAIEDHLSAELDDPEISLSVYAFNSKVYYVIVQGAGSGDQLYRYPIMGNETVIDALSQIQGLTPNSSTRIWVARPGGATDCNDCILPVDWYSITQHGRPETNYQVMPGDRVYVAEDKWVAADTAIAKITAPFERIMGFSLLGVETVSRFSGKVLQRNNNRGGF